MSQSWTLSTHDKTNSGLRDFRNWRRRNREETRHLQEVASAEPSFLWAPSALDAKEPAIPGGVAKVGRKRRRRMRGGEECTMGRRGGEDT